MIVIAFIIYLIHHFFIVGFVASAARWASNALVDLGMGDVAYYAGLGWIGSSTLYWALFFIECIVFVLIFPRQVAEVTKEV